ncbi:MAG: helix-turn-helix domain-containing protein [Ilumatobacteraceae bacterium]
MRNIFPAPTPIRPRADRTVRSSAVLTVPEAAAELRIKRTLAYELARRYLASGGREGLPVIRIGGCLRVPRWALDVLMTTGRVVNLMTEDAPDANGDHDSTTPLDQSKPRRRIRTRAAEQLGLLPND